MACACGRTALPDSRVASRNRTGRKALPPKMSLTASWSSPCRTDCSPVEISGSEVAAASTVAPNRTPERPMSAGDRVAAALQDHPGDEGDECGDAEDRRRLRGGADALAAWPCSVFSGSALRLVLVVGGLARLVPRQRRAGPWQQQQTDHPQHGDEHGAGASRAKMRVVGQLGAGDHHDEHGDHQRALEDEDEARRPGRSAGGGRARRRRRG